MIDYYINVLYNEYIPENEEEKFNMNTNVAMKKSNLSHFPYQQIKKEKNVYEDYLIWLSNLSDNTQIAYSRHLTQFFMWYKSKTIEELVPSDVYIENTHMILYRNAIKKSSNDYSNSTINAMVDAVKSFYSFLETNSYEVKAAWVALDPLHANVKHAGAITMDEAEEMARLASFTQKGFEKSVLIELAYTTSFRKESLLELTMKDFKENHIDKSIIEVSVIGKGDLKHTVFIRKPLFNKVKEVYNSHNKETIFSISPTTVQSMMNSLRKKMNIAPERNVVFHSLRGVMATFGSLDEAQAHYNHSSEETTRKFYRRINSNFSNSLSLRIDQKVEKEDFENMSKEELVEMLMKQNQADLMKLKNSIK